MQETPNPTPAALEEKKENVETLGSTIEFRDLFRVKGKKGLFSPASKPTKSGLVHMVEFLGDQRCTVHVRDLECLDRLVFFKSDNSTIKISEVFDNIAAYDGFKELNFIVEKMAVMVPGYDPEKFKPYHAERVYEWYNEIVSKLDK
jgi:hypothetical protein